jgi:hypothetical protein
MKCLKVLSLIGLIGYFSVSCGGSATNSGGINEGSLTRVPNPVQQSLQAQAPQQAGAMVNTLLQFDPGADNENASLMNFLKNSVIKNARAAIGPDNAIPEGSACDLITEYGPNSITFLQSRSGSFVESGSYGARASVELGNVTYSLEQAISEANFDNIFCVDTDGNSVDASSKNNLDPNFDEESELFSSFQISEKLIQCADFSSPEALAEENNVEGDELALYENVENYIALSGRGIARTQTDNLATGDENRLPASMVVYGEFTFNNVVDGEVQVGEDLGVTVNCTFAISASGFFDPSLSRCTDLDGNLVSLDTEDDQGGNEPVCEFIGNL